MSEIVKEWHRKLKSVGKLNFAEKYNYSGTLEDEEVIEVIEEVLSLYNGSRFETVMQVVLKAVARTAKLSGKRFPEFMRVFRILKNMQRVEVSSFRGIEVYKPTHWKTTT